MRASRIWWRAGQPSPQAASGGWSPTNEAKDDKEHIMALHVVVQPRFGDTARVTTEATGRPQLVADIGTGGTLSVQVDDELGSVELAAQFARELAAAALRFAQRCAELVPGPAVVVPAAPRDGGVSNGA
ncbi:MAG: hypothetical protein WCF33_24605 [Pseudonocardiaceae bacterium]